MESCCHVWAGAPSCYLELLDKLQNCRTVGPSLSASLEPLSLSQLKSYSLSLFFRYYFGRFSSEMTELVPPPYSQGRSTCCSDRLHDFCHHYILDVTKMSMPPASFLAQLDFGITCL